MIPSYALTKLIRGQGHHAGAACRSTRHRASEARALRRRKRAGKRGPTPKLQRQVERLSQLPQAQQRMVMQMLEGFLDQAAKSG